MMTATKAEDTNAIVVLSIAIIYTLLVDEMNSCHNNGRSLVVVL